jgi:gliding motility-associated-like protein
MTPTPKAFVPNAFNPNETANANSYLRPNLVFARKSAPYEFLVFNRYGEKVYESNQPAEFWTGTYQGVPAPMDTYIWHLKFTGIDGIEYVRKGVTTLIR